MSSTALDRRASIEPMVTTTEPATHVSLAALRRAVGYSLRELALLAAVSPQHLHRAERGERGLSPEARVRIMRALGLDLPSARSVPELAPEED